MNIKYHITVLSAAAAALFAVSARAEYSASIRWQVDSATIDGEAATFSWAQFKVADVADAYLFANPNDVGGNTGVPDSADAVGPSYNQTGPDHTSLFAADTTITPATVNYASDDHQFYVELWGGDEGLERVLGYSQIWSYSDLLKDGYIHEGGSAMGSAANVLHVTAFSATLVPEPTSGLLMLIGLAGLALRRRSRS